MTTSEASRADCVDLGDSSDFRSDVLAGLGGEAKSMPAKYLYDAAGIKLLDLMRKQPEYYPSVSEDEIYGYFAGDIGQALGAGPLLLQVGQASLESVHSLLDHIQNPAGYVGVGPSKDALRPSLEVVSDAYPSLPVACITGDLPQAERLPDRIEELGGRRTIFCPGGAIGNLDQDQARELLVSFGRLVGEEGKILVAVDLEKPVEMVASAYNDRAQIADRFHLNMLRRANRELGADFDLMKFRYEAAFNSELGRMEMFGLSMASQEVTIGDQRFSLANNERICTQVSYKYTTDQFQVLVESAELKAVQLWLDSNKYFSAYLLER